MEFVQALARVSAHCADVADSACVCQSHEAAKGAGDAGECDLLVGDLYRAKFFV